MATKKPNSWNDIRQRASAFARRWSDATSESAEAQTFWNELLQVYGIDRKRVAVFEKRAERLSTGKSGRVDLFWPRVLLAEHKSAGKSLDDAEVQAFDYLDSLPASDHPELIITSDFKNIRVLDLAKTGQTQSYTFSLSDLPKEADRLGILAGYKRRQFSEEISELANIRAAKIMAGLYIELERSGCEDHAASVILARILFLLFADDTGIQEKDLFYDWILERTSEDGSDLGSQLELLFQTLNKPDKSRSRNLDESFARFPYANGGIFAEHLEVVSFDKNMRLALLDACGFDWGMISPAVFGSMFQAVKSKKARAQLGEHYTTEANIMKALRPLILDELESELQRGFDSTRILGSLHDRLSRIRVLDPACGCGNFLVVAYREIRDIERRLIIRMKELRGDMQILTNVELDLRVKLGHFFGIEIEEWPARVAETALFLVGHQANVRLSETLGIAPEPLPISDAATIIRGNALEMDWNDLVPARSDLFVVGNPPFVGMSKMNTRQQSDNRRVFEYAERTLRTGRLDYVACWYMKALQYIHGTTARVAFVSTNSISQGEQARTMNPLLAGFNCRIDFAHRTFLWTSEAPDAANVHCVVIGFSMNVQTKHQVRLFDYPDLRGEPVESSAPFLNSYLFVSDLPVPEKHSRPFIDDIPPMRQGSKPWDGGGLVVKPGSERAEVDSDPIALQYLRPFVGSDEMISDLDRWCFWLEDAPLAEVRKSSLLKRRLAHVTETRLATPTEAVQRQAATPWLFNQRRQPTDDYLALPEVSSVRREYIPMRMYSAEVIASNKLMTISAPPKWLVGVLLSACFTLWVKTFAGRLKSDPSISPDLTYNAFPFPALSDSKIAKLSMLVDKLMSVRKRYLRPDPVNILESRGDEANEDPTKGSLDDIYDPLLMPKDLRSAHQAIDKVVDSSFGLKSVRTSTDSERLRVMLERYHALSGSV